MKLYAILYRPENRFVRFGMNGGGSLGYCLYCGNVAAFEDCHAASVVRASFDVPADFEVVEFNGGERSRQ